MEFQHTDKVKDLLERVTKFMDDHVYEGEKVYADQMTQFRNCLLYTSDAADES